MKILKKYFIVAAITLPVLILVAIKIFSISSFKYDAKKWSMPSFNGSNIVSTTEIETRPGEKLIINLDNDYNGEPDKSIARVDIPPDAVLEIKSLKIMREHKGPLLLYSADPALSSRIWMILSQTGLKNIYILTSDKDNEIFKNKFRPDTLTRPEFSN